MISMPMPMPVRKRQTISPSAVDCNAITADATEYQSSDTVNIVRRPKRSGSHPNASVPASRPPNVAAMNPAMPFMPKNVPVVVASRPLFVMPGAM